MVKRIKSSDLGKAKATGSMNPVAATAISSGWYPMPVYPQAKRPHRSPQNLEQHPPTAASWFHVPDSKCKKKSSVDIQFPWTLSQGQVVQMRAVGGRKQTVDAFLYEFLMGQVPTRIWKVFQRRHGERFGVRIGKRFRFKMEGFQRGDPEYSFCLTSVDAPETRWSFTDRIRDILAADECALAIQVEKAAGPSSEMDDAPVLVMKDDRKATTKKRKKRNESDSESETPRIQSDSQPKDKRPTPSKRAKPQRTKDSTKPKAGSKTRKKIENRNDDSSSDGEGYVSDLTEEEFRNKRKVAATLTTQVKKKPNLTPEKNGTAVAETSKKGMPTKANALVAERSTTSSTSSSSSSSSSSTSSSSSSSTSSSTNTSSSSSSSSSSSDESTHPASKAIANDIVESVDDQGKVLTPKNNVAHQKVAKSPPGKVRKRAASTPKTKKPTTEKMTDAQKKKEEIWKTRFQELVDFKNKHGHCKVTRTFENEKLARWVESQRKLGKTYPLSSMTKEHRQSLDILGFHWAVPKGHITKGYYSTKEWQECFDELVKFKNKHGHCKVTRKCENEKLARWVEAQRQLGRTYPKCSMTKEHHQSLEELGFHWSTAATTKPRHWNYWFGQLTEFKKIHGHCLVSPTIKDADPGLQHWVSAQRRLGKQYPPLSPLTEERYKALHDLGFVWVVAKPSTIEDIERTGIVAGPIRFMRPPEPGIDT